LALVGISFELMVEAPRWYVAGQFAVVTPMIGIQRLEYGEFAGARSGAFLSEQSTSPFVGLGVGWIGLYGLLSGDALSDGWGVTAEAGIAFRRDKKWFHPQLALQAFVPLGQKGNGSAGAPPDHPVGLFVAGRFFL
jgi:hypothetical protein